MPQENPSTKAEDYQDVELACFVPGCNMLFIWTQGEQAFMAQLLTAGKIDAITKPKRCIECRLEKRADFARKEQEETNQ